MPRVRRGVGRMSDRQKAYTLANDKGWSGGLPVAGANLRAGPYTSVEMDTMQSTGPADGDNRIGANHSPLTRLVVDALREKILNGEIGPGERLALPALGCEVAVDGFYLKVFEELGAD